MASGMDMGHNPGSVTTLDEPISATVLRDLRAIGRKIQLVLGYQSENYSALRNWDLWGPLVLCLFLAILLGLSKQAKDEKGQTFAGVFSGISLGSGVVTLNAQFLGARLSFFQIVCVLGYCLFPLCVAAVLCLVLPSSTTVTWSVLRWILCSLACSWAVFASLRFLSGAVKDQRRALVVYPITLFYFFVSWMLVAGI
eukprot:RCo004643